MLPAGCAAQRRVRGGGGQWLTLFAQADANRITVLQAAEKHVLGMTQADFAVSTVEKMFCILFLQVRARPPARRPPRPGLCPPVSLSPAAQREDLLKEEERTKLRAERVGARARARARSALAGWL